MKGITGLSGTVSLPAAIDIFPPLGGVTSL
jgi:hypothetical protein